MRLRYTGRRPVTLMTLGLDLEPGAEIELPDAEGVRFAARPDFDTLDAPAEQSPEPEAGDGARSEAEGAAHPAVKRKPKAGADADQTTDTASAA